MRHSLTGNGDDLRSLNNARDCGNSNAGFPRPLVAFLCCYFFNRLLAMPTSPANPLPKRIIVEGMGTTVLPMPGLTSTV